MESPAAPGSSDWRGGERRQTDRRNEPTKPLGLFGRPLRRVQGRRADDHSSYVDRYSKQEVVLLLSIFILNVGDAFFTMLWLSRGGREANPVMDFFLDIGPAAFLIQKCIVVGFWLLLLLVHKNFRFAKLGLYATFAVYALLMVVHFGIIAFGINPPPQPKTDGPLLEQEHGRIIPADAAKRLGFEADPLETGPALLSQSTASSD